MEGAVLLVEARQQTTNQWSIVAFEEKPDRVRNDVRYLKKT
jgi:hypothetical protein